MKFNGKEFTIIPNQQIEEAAVALIREKKLDKKKPSDIFLPSRAQIRDYILTESKPGGELDFFTEIKGREAEGIQIKPGLFTTNHSVALYKWARACFEIGVNTLEDTYAIFAEHQGEPANRMDMEYMRMGYYKEWEK